jgi:hypothetical protein
MICGRLHFEEENAAQRRMSLGRPFIGGGRVRRVATTDYLRGKTLSRRCATWGSGLHECPGLERPGYIHRSLPDPAYAVLLLLRGFKRLAYNGNFAVNSDTARLTLSRTGSD